MARILIVDDNINNAEMMAIVVSFLGHEPIIAFSGKQAIAVISSEHVDFVLLDYIMPGLNGIDTREIRSLNNGWSFPVYIYSGIQSTKINEKVKSEGASGVLQKPISIKYLEKLLRESTILIESVYMIELLLRLISDSHKTFNLKCLLDSLNTLNITNHHI